MDSFGVEHLPKMSWPLINIGKDWLCMKGLQELQKLITSPQYAINLFSICFNLFDASSISQFPTIKFHFKDANGNGTIHFVTAPKNYIFLYLELLYCLTILFNSKEGLSISIIGDLTQANH